MALREMINAGGVMHINCILLYDLRIQITCTIQGRIQNFELGGANGVECECADPLCVSAIQGGLAPRKFLDFTYSDIDSDAIWTVITITELILKIT